MNQNDIAELRRTLEAAPTTWGCIFDKAEGFYRTWLHHAPALLDKLDADAARIAELERESNRRQTEIERLRLERNERPAMLEQRVSEYELIGRCGHTNIEDYEKTFQRRCALDLRDCRAALRSRSGGEDTRDDNSAGDQPAAAPAPGLTGESDALRVAVDLAVALHGKHYSDNKRWRPASSLVEVILQIDNMTAGLARAATKLAPVAEPVACRTRDKRRVSNLRIEGRSGWLLGEINDEPFIWHPGGYWAKDRSEQPLDLEFAVGPTHPEPVTLEMTPEAIEAAVAAYDDAFHQGDETHVIQTALAAAIPHLGRATVADVRRDIADRAARLLETRPFDWVPAMAARIRALGEQGEAGR